MTPGQPATADYAAARGIDLTACGGHFRQRRADVRALFGSEHLGTLLLTRRRHPAAVHEQRRAHGSWNRCANWKAASCWRGSPIRRTRYVITKSGGFGQEDLLVELADRIAKH